MAAHIYTVGGVPISTLGPKFLHTNSTSHTWPFGAIAELIDNAYDPDVSATQFWIDKTEVNGHECLTFTDNGHGLDHETMHKMLSFGYSDKTAVNDRQPIGMYGNGFKSGSMRLGKDAVVFSQSKSTSCIGMLSQTYLKAIGAEQIIVPIICLENIQAKNVREEHRASLEAILRHSPFKTQEELLVELKAISYSSSKEKTGTRIIIWNLRSPSTGKTEFDFESDRYDIRIPSSSIEGTDETHIPQCVYSLRAYCSILYLKPSMKINIRGTVVHTVLIKKSLAFTKKDFYKPSFQANAIPITFGYNTKSKEQYGVMMYYKKRLIKAYERVGCQLRTNYKGVGVIGVMECDFLKPTHNKQSFDETDTYRKTMNSLGIKLEEYWKEIKFERSGKDNNGNSAIPVEDMTKKPDQNWAQCDDCGKWRKLPDGINTSNLPDKWYCHENQNPMYRSCIVEEEPEDSDDEQTPYQKTYKKQEREDKKKQEMQRQKEEEDRKREEEQRLAMLANENQKLKRQLSKKNAHPTHIGPKTVLPRAATVSSSPISQAVSSPSSTRSAFPVISEVWSTNPSCSKRTKQPASPHTTPKRPKVNGSVRIIPLVPAANRSNNNKDDDDIVILETVSTPKPQVPSFDLTTVKSELKEEEAEVDVLLQCDDDGGAMETDVPAAGARSSPTPTPKVTSCTTQTEVRVVKKEKEDQGGPEREERAGQSASKKSRQDQSSDVDVDVCNGGTNHPDVVNDPGPSCAEARDKWSRPPDFPGMAEAQAQQDQLLELMQSTAQERDSLKEQVHNLTCELQDAQSRLQELTMANFKKESSHQHSQTDQTGPRTDYKRLFERSKKKVRELIKDREDVMTATEAKLNVVKGDEEDTDEIAAQVGSLIRALDRTNKDRDELRSQLDGLEEERANLATKCEELQLSLQQQREAAANLDPQVAGATADCAKDAATSLIELRHNVGRLLISHVPALDLGQVNYDCNVIDEILEQVLTEKDSVNPLGFNDTDRNT